MTGINWVARMERMPILPAMTRLTRLPRLGRLTGLALLDILIILTRVISMERLNGKDRQEGLYRRTVSGTRTRLIRTISPTSRRYQNTRWVGWMGRVGFPG